MKKITLFLFAFLLTFFSYGQKKSKEERQRILDERKAGISSKNYYPRDSLNYEVKYCQILAIGKFLSHKVDIRIDYGQNRGLITDERIRNKDGKRIEFYSVIDALNYMNHLGWDLINAYPITVGNQNVYHYYFKAREDASRDFIPEVRRDFKNKK